MMKNEQQRPVRLPVTPVALPVDPIQRAPPSSSRISRRALALGLGAFVTLFLLTHSGVLSTLSSSLFGSPDATDGTCGWFGSPGFEFVPGPGRWESGSTPRDVTVEMKGAATGTFTISSDASTDVAVTTAVFHVSPKNIADLITVSHVVTEEGGYVVNIHTPENLVHRQCIHADVVLTLPAQKDPKVNLALAARNSRFTLNDMRDVRFTNVGVESTNGRIETHGLEVAGKLALTSTNGALIVDNLDAVVADSVVLKTTNGPVDVRSADVQTLERNAVPVTGLHVQTTNAPVTLDAVSASTVVAHSSNGRIVLDAVTITHSDTDLQTTNSDISGNLFLIGGALAATTSNGRVALVVKGRPKTVRAVTSNSPVSVRMTNEGYKGTFRVQAGKYAGVEVTGEDVHFTGDPKVKNVQEGWKGAEEGEQSVVIKTTNGGAKLAFA
ncbi:hypothetical protein HKX48_007382 [Thoreauomyces humboldtii]|nr:hypothetical protein HKX48_007382 [Thoreauomyces humboldtii]